MSIVVKGKIDASTKAQSSKLSKLLEQLNSPVVFCCSISLCAPQLVKYHCEIEMPLLDE
jgi:hypothetical protein